MTRNIYIMYVSEPLTPSFATLVSLRVSTPSILKIYEHFMNISLGNGVRRNIFGIINNAWMPRINVSIKIENKYSYFGWIPNKDNIEMFHTISMVVKILDKN